jgi:hypothetical protein
MLWWRFLGSDIYIFFRFSSCTLFLVCCFFPLKYSWKITRGTGAAPSPSAVVSTRTWDLEMQFTKGGDTAYEGRFWAILIWRGGVGENSAIVRNRQTSHGKEGRAQFVLVDISRESAENPLQIFKFKLFCKRAISLSLRHELLDEAADAALSQCKTKTAAAKWIFDMFCGCY